eukprot:GGOE01049292.1.p1 GENE.GGOE01049292.1~~GGOE01049292.1.p1  ORF type:complete len:215 (-),score=29.70 GGOE01049292.1:166-810(-)
MSPTGSARVRFFRRMYSTMNRTEAFHIMGISPTSSNAEIQARYRELAKQFHPDRNPNGGQHFQHITAAYELIRSGKAETSWDSGDHPKAEAQHDPQSGRMHSSSPDFPMLYVLGLLGASALMLMVAQCIISWDRHRHPTGAELRAEMSARIRMLRLDGLYHNRSNSLHMAEFAYRSELAKKQNVIMDATSCPENVLPIAGVSTPIASERCELCD